MHTIDPAIGLNSLHQTFVEPPAQAPVRDNPGKELRIVLEFSRIRGRIDPLRQSLKRVDRLICPSGPGDGAGRYQGESHKEKEPRCSHGDPSSHAQPTLSGTTVPPICSATVRLRGLHRQHKPQDASGIQAQRPTGRVGLGATRRSVAAVGPNL